MVRTAKDFFDDFDKLIKDNALIPDYVPARLIHYNINGIDVGPEDIVQIVEGIKQGNREQLNRWNDLKEYLIRTQDLIEYNKSQEYDNRELLENIYGFRRHLGLVEEVDVPSIEYRMEIIINRLLNNDFRMKETQLGDFFGLMKPSEKIGLTSLQRQGIEKKNKKRMTLPREIFEDEISSFVGKTIKGGRRRSKKMKSMRRKNKRKRTHTKR
jgi:hypothetical protein